MVYLGRPRQLHEFREHTYREWIELCELWHWRCFYCKRELDELSAHRDHQIPLSRGGSDKIENIVPCCQSCNSKKGAKTAEEFYWARRDTGYRENGDGSN